MSFSLASSIQSNGKSYCLQPQNLSGIQTLVTSHTATMIPLVVSPLPVSFQPHWPTCFSNLPAILMLQGLCTYHSHCLIQSSLLGPQNFLPLGICSLVCSSVTFSVRPYMNSLFKMAISLLTLALFIILHYLPISDILYILLIYFVLPTSNITQP